MLHVLERLLVAHAQSTHCLLVSVEQLRPSVGSAGQVRSGYGWNGSGSKRRKSVTQLTGNKVVADVMTEEDDRSK